MRPKKTIESSWTDQRIRLERKCFDGLRSFLRNINQRCTVCARVNNFKRTEPTSSETAFAEESVVLRVENCRRICYVLVFLSAVLLVSAYFCSRSGDPLLISLTPYLLVTGIFMLVMGFGFFCMAKQEESEMQKAISEELAH